MTQQPLDLTSAAPHGGGGCGCGRDAGEPVLDVRVIPAAVRHGAVFGAFDSLPEGGTIVLVAPHEPKPLLAQLASRGLGAVETLVAGPQEWHLRLTKGVAAV